MAYSPILNPHPVTIPALLAGSNVIGAVTQSGTWNIGAIATLPALAAGAAVIGSLAANQSVNVAQMNGVATTMGSGAVGTGVQRVVLATDVALPTGANVIGAVTQSGTWNVGTVTTLPALPANQSVNASQINGVAPLMGTGISGTGALRVTLATDIALPTGANTIGTVNGPTLTKGTQGATGYSVQNLKDAGRNQTNFFMAVPIITTAAEVMQSMTGYKSGAAVTATTTPAVVTAGKTYRVTKIILTYFNVAAVGSARVNLRANTAGVAVVGSPLVSTWQVGLSGDGASTAGHASTYDFSFPDGIEFAAGTGIAFGAIGEGAVPTTATIVGYVLIQCFGFEY